MSLIAPIVPQRLGYVITHIDTNGMRRLSYENTPSNVFSFMEEAEKRVIRNKQLYGSDDTVAVRKVFLKPDGTSATLFFGKEDPYLRKIRYCLTHLDDKGLRVMSQPNQARHHFDTEEEAIKFRESLLAYTHPATLTEIYGKNAVGSFKVTPTECYANGDSVRTVFEEPVAPPPKVTSEQLSAELKALSLPLIQWLRRTYDPHTEITIAFTGAWVNQSMRSVVFTEEEIENGKAP